MNHPPANLEDIDDDEEVKMDTLLGLRREVSIGITNNNGLKIGGPSKLQRTLTFTSMSLRNKY